jgi:hypothetical protein
MRTICRTSLAATMILCVVANYAAAQVTEEELHNKLDVLCAGRDTPAAEVEAQGQALLQRHSDGDSQGRICFRMALVFGVSGPVADKTAEYAQKALACPVKPEERLTMYCYWGDALQVTRGPVAGNNLPPVRREAVMPYLQGLKETLKYNLPDDPPKIPGGGTFINFEGAGPIPEGIQRARRAEEARAKAAENVRWQVDMIERRETLIGQIVFMYSRKPLATDEIRVLATQVIADDHLVGRLMAAVEDAINERATTGGIGTPYMLKMRAKFRDAIPSANTEQPAAAATSKP